MHANETGQERRPRAPAELVPPPPPPRIPSLLRSFVACFRPTVDLSTFRPDDRFVDSQSCFDRASRRSCRQSPSLVALPQRAFPPPSPSQRGRHSHSPSHPFHLSAVVILAPSSPHPARLWSRSDSNVSVLVSATASHIARLSIVDSTATLFLFFLPFVLSTSAPRPPLFCFFPPHPPRPMLRMRSSSALGTRGRRAAVRPAMRVADRRKMRLRAEHPRHRGAQLQRVFLSRGMDDEKDGNKGRTKGCVASLRSADWHGPRHPPVC